MRTVESGTCFVCGRPWHPPDTTLLGRPVHRTCWKREGDQRTRDIFAGRIPALRATLDTEGAE